MENDIENEKCDDCLLGISSLDMIVLYEEEKFQSVAGGFEFPYCPECGHKNNHPEDK